MTDCFTPVMRALVVASLLLATATLMLVVANTARASGALAAGSSAATYDVGAANKARRIARAGI